MLSGLTWVQGHSLCTPWGDSSLIWVHWNLLTSIDSHFGLFQQHSLAMLSWSEYFWRLILLSTHIVSTVSFHKHCPFLKISPHPGKRWLQHGASEERKGQTWGLRLDLKSSRTGGCRKAQSRLPCSERVMGLRQQHHCCGVGRVPAGPRDSWKSEQEHNKPLIYTLPSSDLEVLA